MPTSWVASFALETQESEIRTSKDRLFRGYTFVSAHGKTLFDLKLGAVAKVDQRVSLVLLSQLLVSYEVSWNSKPEAYSKATLKCSVKLLAVLGDHSFTFINVTS